MSNKCDVCGKPKITFPESDCEYELSPSPDECQGHETSYKCESSNELDY